MAAMMFRKACCVALAMLCLLLCGVGVAGEAPVAAEPAVQLMDSQGLRELLTTHDDQLVVVNFWATWCRPCLEEIPVLQKLEAETADLVLVPVSLDQPDAGEEPVARFVRKWFPGFRSWLSVEREMDTMVSVIDMAWNEVLPTSYVIAPGGQVAARLQGGKSAEEFAAAIAAARP